MDAVFYLLDALRLFRGKSLEEIREITFEIGMLGRHGLDINDPQETHVLRALPGRVFSALELVCIMYAGFKRIEPGMDLLRLLFMVSSHYLQILLKSQPEHSLIRSKLPFLI